VFLYFLEHRMMGKLQKPSNSVCERNVLLGGSGQRIVRKDRQERINEEDVDVKKGKKEMG
jgi:hypothetical protein